MADNKFTIELYVNHIKDRLDFPVSILNYEEAREVHSFQGACVIFCDMERFTGDLMQQAENLYDRACREGAKHALNNPRKVLRRYDLLKKLFAEGINSFDVHRFPLENGAVRFPVFLRNEIDHQGPLSGLLHSAEEIMQSLAAPAKRVWGPFSPLVVEYCDARNEEMSYHKYGAFFLYDTIVPRHLFFGDQWMVKGSVDQRPMNLEKEKAYIDNNDFSAELSAIFRLAQIDYGRVDFAYTKRGVEVFEINTNPTMLDTGDLNSNREYATNAFLDNFTACLQRLHDGV